MFVPAPMEDRKNHARGLEEVSHLFLSGLSAPEKARRLTHEVVQTDAGEIITKPDITARKSPMLQTIYDAKSTVIPRQELLDAAKSFLLCFGSDKDLILVDNIYSPKFGSSDLLLVNHAKTNLTVGRLNNRAEDEKFIIESISYYFWLKEFITISEILFNNKCGVGMYLFSHDFSAASRYLIDNLIRKLNVYLIKYNILQSESLNGPAIYFQHIAPIDHAKKKPVKKEDKEDKVVSTGEKEGSAALKISAQELREFDRLTELYLDP